MQAYNISTMASSRSTANGQARLGVEEGTGSEIEKNRIIVISCKQVRTTKVKASKTERKNTAGRGNDLKP